MSLKVGPHASTNPTGLGTWLSARPTVAVYQGAFYGDNNPGTLVIGRPVNTDYLTPEGDPVAAAERWWADRLWPTAAGNPHIKTWIASNEPDWKDTQWSSERKAEALTWYGRFDYRLAQIAHAHGLTLVLGNPAVGCWEVEYLQYWAGGMRACREFGAYYGAHYYGPLDRWHALKYQEDLRAFSAAGYPDIRIIGTEGGAERVAGGQPWRQQYGSVARYVAEWVRPFELAARNWPGFVGLALFTLGDPGGWSDYDVAGDEFPAAMVALSRELGDIARLPGSLRVTADVGLRLRTGPGVTYPIVTVLSPQQHVALIGISDGWAEVNTGRFLGWASMKYLQPVSYEAPPVARETAIQAMARLAPTFGVDVAIGLAVLRVEAGGVAFGKDGRMIVRFEPHVFRGSLRNQALFDAHFQVGVGGVSTWDGAGHRFRAGLLDPWRPFHGNQATEWEALIVARTLSDEGALRSISMGAGQVMGFNHRAVGYESARAMFDALHDSAEAQVHAMLTYCKSRGLIGALAQGDFLAFARGYNGSGQAERYARLIEQAAKLNGWVRT